MVFGGDYYEHNITKKMVITFGSCFNNMTVERWNEAGTETELIHVPIIYAAKEKMLARLQADPNLDRPFSALLPRISFEIVDLYPARDRHLPTLNKRVTKNSSNVNKFNYQYTAVPYDIKFNLYIYTKNAQDGTKILEQILPFFTPDWTASVEIINTPDLVETRDIPIVLDSVGLADLYDGDFKVKRTIVWTLAFTMKTYYYGPVKVKPIIKFVEVREIMGDPTTATANDAIEAVTMQPALTIDGKPTTNVAASVSYLTISVDDDYGFGETVVRIDPGS